MYFYVLCQIIKYEFLKIPLKVILFPEKSKAKDACSTQFQQANK
jgi:hypothetical protein